MDRKSDQLTGVEAGRFARARRLYGATAVAPL